MQIIGLKVVRKIGWVKPNEAYAALRSTSVEYADGLINDGTIVFNCAKSWVEMERKNGKGQGDLYEGIFAACEPLDYELAISYKQRFYDVETEFDGKLIYFRRKSVMQMPAYCFFILKQSLFECPEKDGNQKITGHIPGIYFQDFAGGKTIEEIMLLPEKKRPSIVLMNDIDRFIRMIKKKLISMGVNRKDIFVYAISYKDKHTPFLHYGNSPRELFLKDISFSHQSECRIVINTTDRSLIDILVGKPINIGPIKEFAQKCDTYLKEGAIVEMNVLVEAIEE
jgi:hypothetical protein